MGYVGWCFEKAGKGEETQAQKEDAFYYWQDLVTNTQYFISIEDYNRIYAAGKEKLAKCWEADDLKGMEGVFYEPKGTDDISLFAVLPYMMEGLEKCVRICDYVCFWMACLYALCYGSMKRSVDIEREKRKVRMQGLLWEFVSGVGDCPELEQIKQMMQSAGQGANFNIAQHKADVVKGGTIKIKQYYLETNKIPEIQGASILLDTVNLKKMQEAREKREYVCKNLCPGCQLFGSKIMASKIFIADAYPIGDYVLGERTGVGINRITGAAQHKALYDFETVEEGTFQVGITLKNYELYQMALLMYVLKDLDDGYVTLGAASTRGNGLMGV